MICTIFFIFVAIIKNVIKMLTNNFITEEQLQFKVLESKKCPVHKQSVRITFYNGAPQIKNCCCNAFERYLLSQIHAIIPNIIAARR